LKVLNIEIKDPQKNLNQKFDLTQEVSANQSGASIILQNVLNLNPISSNATSSLETNIEFEVENDNLKIQKSYSTGVTKYLINNQEQQINPYDWISEKIGIKLDPPTWESRLIDFRNINIQNKDDLLNLFKAQDSKLQINTKLQEDQKALAAEFEQLKNSSIQGLTQEQIQKIDRLRDIKFRIAKIQKEVDSYQSQKEGKEDLNKQVKDKENEVNSLREKLESVSALMQSRGQISLELQKFGVQNNQNLEALRQEKFAQTNNFLQTAYTKPKNSLANQKDDSERGFELTPRKILLIIQIPATVALMIIAYFLIRQSLILLLGVIVILLEFVMIIFEFQKKPKNEDSYVLMPETPQVTAQQLPVDNTHNQIFISNAYRSAYEQELNRIDQLISTNLNNRTYQEVELEKNQKENDLSNLKRQQDNINQNSMDSEAYYKKRRELDILKIEKENLEFGSNLQIPNEEQLDQLNQKISEIEDKIYSIDDEKTKIPFIAINVGESVKNFIKELRNSRQIILISSRS